MVISLPAPDGLPVNQLVNGTSLRAILVAVGHYSKEVLIAVQKLFYHKPNSKKCF